VPISILNSSSESESLKNDRATYDKHGKSMVDKEGGMNMEDAAGFFANVFGGERFVDYVRPSTYNNLVDSWM
jgi:hypothetical protein